jgi:hypothetical protein
VAMLEIAEVRGDDGTSRGTREYSIDISLLFESVGISGNPGLEDDASVRLVHIRAGTRIVMREGEGIRGLGRRVVSGKDDVKRAMRVDGDVHGGSCRDGGVF